MRTITPLLLASTFILSQNALSFERDHGAHEHGHATLAIAIDTSTIQLSFTSPAMNIVGFEHKASSKEDKKKLKEAKKTLEDAKKRFVFNDEAKCKAESSKISSALLTDEHHDHGKKDKHAEDKDHHHDKKHHDKNDEKHDEKHHGEHDEQHSDESHSEFDVEYTFTCKHIDKLSHVDVNLFTPFPSLEELETQILSDKGQQLIQLTPASSRVKF